MTTKKGIDVHEAEREPLVAPPSYTAAGPSQLLPAGPSPIATLPLPPPATLDRERSNRDADRRARYRLFSAYVVAVFIWLLFSGSLAQLLMMPKHHHHGVSSIFIQMRDCREMQPVEHYTISTTGNYTLDIRKIIADSVHVVIGESDSDDIEIILQSFAPTTLCSFIKETTHIIHSLDVLPSPSLNLTIHIPRQSQKLEIISTNAIITGAYAMNDGGIFIINNSNGQINLALALLPAPHHSQRQESYRVDLKNSNAAIGLDFMRQPVESRLKLDVGNTNGEIQISLHDQFQGNFTARTSDDEIKILGPFITTDPVAHLDRHLTMDRLSETEVRGGIVWGEEKGGGGKMTVTNSNAPVQLLFK